LYQEIFKPFIDKVVSVLLVLTLTPMIFLFILILRQKFSNKFFTQNRIGINNRPFLLYKLKTMSDETDSDGVLLPDSQRLTKWGKLLRNTSLDELPQLFNVLKGDMSFVGPRPLLPQYLRLYTKEQLNRHNVKPGITGWAQVNGRNAITWKEKFDLDVYYVKNQSFLLDIKIIWMTVLNVIKRKDISGEGTPTMQPFRGDN
jgi:undecaprenyl phosphate N,N'-diacetylbacillosamine 1-phosphate transferase